MAAANPKTVVVLETAGPVTMPWRDRTGAILEAWYPGARGGEAIAKVLFGEVNPQGRLPASFPASDAQLARPRAAGLGPEFVETLTPARRAKALRCDLCGGLRRRLSRLREVRPKPLYPFGYGLSYTTFRYSGLKVTGGKTLTATLHRHQCRPTSPELTPRSSI